MVKVKNFIKANLVFILIFLVALFFRFYRLYEFAQFLSDQGRDAIIIKRIITFEHFPAVGPSTSIGQVYLGPFFYYFIAPWLFIFRFNPVGLAFGTAFFSIFFLALSFFVIKNYFGKTTALFFLLFNSFSYILIDFSRFSWNPNLLPYFSFFSVYLFIKARETNKKFLYFLAGSFLSFSIQLHYLALTIIPPLAIIFLKDLYQNFKKQWLNILYFFFAFFIFTSPLLIFDLRHQFLNAKNLVNLFKTGSTVGMGRLENLIATFSKLNEYSFATQFNFYFNLALLLIIILISANIFWKKNPLRYHLFFFLFILLGTSFYNGPKHAHYFGALYVFYYLILSYFLSFVLNNFLGKILICLFFIAFIILNWQKYYFLSQKPPNQILHSQKVADFLAKKIAGKPFNIATWPVEFFEDSYLYFLELKNLRPADRLKQEITNQMFVLCAKTPCQIINSPSWNISMFGPAKIDKIWDYEGLKIYKLVHKK